MLSDDSSTDSETGRFKGRSEKQDQQSRGTSRRDHNIRSSGRDRHSENDRSHREANRKRVERDKYDKPRERHRFSRNSPIRRRRSNDRSPIRKRSRERQEFRRLSREKTKEHRSSSRDRHHASKSRPPRPVEQKRDIKEELNRNVTQREEISPLSSSKHESSDKFNRWSRNKQSSSPEVKVKRSEIHKPTSTENKKRSESPIVVDKDSGSEVSEEVKPGSYYSMVPTVIKEKSGSSEIDSSDDEKLRAKLLNLEKELHQAKKKKHKKKHRKKGKSSKEEKDHETSTPVEVSSTSDIKKKVQTEVPISNVDATEVTSTQKNSQVESNEEGEILSDDDSASGQDIDPNDLRHKLKRSVVKVEPVERIDLRGKVCPRSNVCGPALPPHLEARLGGYEAADAEGPALPPHLHKVDRKIGPSIPDRLRKELAQNECEVIKCESSDEDGIGPLPAGAESEWSDAHRKLEERALDMKIRRMDGHSMQSSKVKSREQWMLELPEGKAKYIGLEARTFRAKEGPDMSNRSSWTDTPEEKARKQAGLDREEDPDVVLQRAARARQLADRDDDQERAVKKHKKKHRREESLLEIHEKKIKKKKKKTDKADSKPERRPFSRDVDLQVNRFDEAQKKSVIKKAQQLDSRFSRGEAKYL